MARSTIQDSPAPKLSSEYTKEEFIKLIQEQVDDDERIVIMSSAGSVKVSVKKKTEHIIGKHFAFMGKWVMNLRKNARGEEMDDLRGLDLSKHLPKMIIIVPKEN